MTTKPKSVPAQHQSHQPGKTSKMHPQPQDRMKDYKSANKLADKVAIITGGDSGIGRAVAIGFAKEGAKLVIVYLEETEDAEITKQEIEIAGSECLLIDGDISQQSFSKKIIEKTIRKFGKFKPIYSHFFISPNLPCRI